MHRAVGWVQVSAAVRGAQVEGDFDCFAAVFRLDGNMRNCLFCAGCEIALRVDAGSFSDVFPDGDAAGVSVGVVDIGQPGVEVAFQDIGLFLGQVGAECRVLGVGFAGG